MEKLKIWIILVMIAGCSKNNNQPKISKHYLYSPTLKIVYVNGDKDTLHLKPQKQIDIRVTKGDLFYSGEGNVASFVRSYEVIDMDTIVEYRSHGEVVKKEILSTD